MKLFAWVGPDEFGSGVVGLKQAFLQTGLNAALMPLVCIEAHQDKLRREEFVDQLRHQAMKYGTTIRYLEFEATGKELLVITPDGEVEVK